MNTKYGIKPIYNGTLSNSLTPELWQDNTPREFYVVEFITNTNGSTQSRIGVIIEDRVGDFHGYLGAEQPTKDEDLFVTQRLCSFCGNRKNKTHPINLCNFVQDAPLGETVEVEHKYVGMICRTCSEKINTIQQTVCEKHTDKIVTYTI